jgi:phosphoglycerate kinase
MVLKNKRTVRDVPIDNHTVLVRVDFDAPVDHRGEIVDESRIADSVPTIKYLLDRGCKVVIIGHIGRNQKHSFEKAAVKLAPMLGRNIRFIDGVIGDKVYQAVKLAPKCSVIVLENLRFHEGEESNDHDFARNIAKSTGARYFVQDSIRDVYSSHASTSAITLFIPSVAGLFLERIHSDTTYKLPGIESLLDA